MNKKKQDYPKLENYPIILRIGKEGFIGLLESYQPFNQGKHATLRIKFSSIEDRGIIYSAIPSTTDLVIGIKVTEEILDSVFEDYRRKSSCKPKKSS